jgi:hypothetical protein
MGQASTIGLDIAKRVFQAHGADATGRVVFRKRLMRAKVLEFFAAQPPCLVALEACGGAHYWAREIGKLGHTVHRCCMDQWERRTHPYPVLGSCDADGLRASQLQHAVEGVDGNLHLGRPTLIRARAQPVADHAFEPAHGGLDPGASVVT